MPDVASGKIPIIQVVTSSLRFLVENWRRFTPAALILAGFSALWPLVALGGTPAELSTTNAMQTLGSELGLLLPMIGAWLIYVAAVLRWSIRGEFSGLFGLSLGADEARLAGVFGSLTLLMLPFIFVFVFVIATVLGSKLTPDQLSTMNSDQAAQAIADALGPGGALALMLLILAGFGLAMLAAARLSMTYAATIGEKRIVLLQTWSWSRGNVLRILAVLAMVTMAFLVVDNLLWAAIASVVLALPQAQSLVPLVLAHFVLAYIDFILLLPLINAAAQLYKGLRPPDFKAK